MNKISSYYLSIFLVVITANGLDAIKVCQPSDCQGNQCKSTECYYGECNADGSCNCKNCWTGETCKIYQNAYSPHFTSAIEESVIKDPASTTDIITYVKAVDLDYELTCKNNEKDCDCGRISYAIETGNDENLFSLDAFSGALTLQQSVPADLQDRQHKLVISSVNFATDTTLDEQIVGVKDYMTLKIKVTNSINRNTEKEEDSIHEMHERIRRAAPNTVDNMTFTMWRPIEYNQTRTLFVGSKLHFTLQVQFPPGVTDALVELAAPENGTALMVVYNTQITYSGSNLVYNTKGASPTYNSVDNTISMDRSIIKFGNVTNTNTDTSSSLTSSVIIDWDLVMIDSRTAVKNSTMQWVCAGAEFNKATQIWVGQANFTLLFDDMTRPINTSNFIVSGPSSINMGVPTLFHVDMYMPFPSVSLNVDVFTPYNLTDVMNVCGLVVVDVGQNYDCFNYTAVNPTFYKSNTNGSSERANLNLGKVTNAGSRKNTPFSENVISFEFVVTMPLNSYYLNQTIALGTTVEIGTDLIWTSQIILNVLDYPVTFDAPVINPTVNLAPYPLAALQVEGVIPLQLNITIGPNTLSDYSLQLNAPTSLMRICSIEYVQKGANLACLNITQSPIFYSAGEVRRTSYQSSWYIGVVKDMLQRTNLTTSAPDLLEFKVNVQAISSAIVLNTANNIVARILHSPQVDVSSSLPLTFSSLTLPVQTGLNTPPILWQGVNYPYSLSGYYKNLTMDIRLNITFSAGLFYNPVVLTLNVSKLTDLIRIVRIQTMFVGKNFPCLQKESLDTFSTIQPDQQSAVLIIGSVHNTGGVNISYFNHENKIQLRIGLYIESTSVSSKLNYNLSYASDGRVVSNSLTITSLDGPAYSPFANFFQAVNALQGSAGVGQLIKYQAVLKLSPNSVSDWKVRANVSQSYLSICTMYVESYGANIPFIKLPIAVRAVQTNAINQTAWLELYKLVSFSSLENTTLNYTTQLDSDSVEIIVVVSVAPTAPIGTGLGMVTIAFDEGFDGFEYSQDMTFDITSANTPVVPSGTSTFSDTTLPPNNSTGVPNMNVERGHTFILKSEFTMQPTNLGMSLSASIFSDIATVNLVDIVAFDIIYVDSFYPCLIKENFNAVFTSRGGTSNVNDMATLNLGTVCTSLSLATNYKIIFQAVVTIVRNSQYSGPLAIKSQMIYNGTSSIITTTVNIGTPVIDEMWNFMTLRDQSFTLQNGVPTFSLQPTQVGTVYFNITVKPWIRAVLQINMITTMSNVPVMHLISAKPVSFGKNLGSINALDVFSTTFISSKYTTQKDNATLNLGYITNTGHTYTANKYQSSDDIIIFAVQVMMLDTLQNNNAFSTSLLTNAFLGSKSGITPDQLSQQLTFNINVMRDSTPADIALVVNYDAVSTYASSTTIKIFGQVYHRNFSRAEPNNLTVIFYLPPYIVYLGKFATNFIGVTPVIGNYTNKNTLFIQFDHLYFTDGIVQFNFSLMVTDKKSASATLEKTTISYDLSYSLNFRAEYNKLAGFIYSNMSSLSINTQLNMITTCPSEIALGMQSGAILDCQISGTSSSLSTNQPTNARPGGTGWKPDIKIAKGYQQYLQVKFLNITLVTSVVVTHLLSASTDTVATFYLQYSNDGLAWKNSATMTVVNGSPVPVLVPQEALFVRFVIATLSPAVGQPVVTLEFMGCPVRKIDVELANPCMKNRGFQLADMPIQNYFQRTMLQIQTFLFFCDANNNKYNCFQMTAANTWKELPSVLSMIIGYDSLTNYMFGADLSKQSYLMSVDMWSSWGAVSASRIAAAVSAPTFVSAVNVSLNKDVLSTSFTQGLGAATYNGLNYNAVPVVDWFKCCP